jgi:hypothetical protein
MQRTHMTHDIYVESAGKVPIRIRSCHSLPFLHKIHRYLNLNDTVKEDFL